MKKFEGFLCVFILFVYTEHIREDWSSLNKFGKLIIYPFWFIRSVLIWVISPILIFEFIIKTSDVYKKISNLK